MHRVDEAMCDVSRDLIENTVTFDQQARLYHLIDDVKQYVEEDELWPLVEAEQQTIHARGQNFTSWTRQ
jgi:hypothetical protein